jgi:ubiquinone biosynthesis protein
VDINLIPSLVRNTQRFQQIVSILAKYRLAPWLSELPANWVKDLFVDGDGVRIAELSTAVRVREALTELGTTFIKLGQILSTRPDLVDPEWTVELAKLQSHVPADSAETVRGTIKAELGAEPKSLFAEFDDQPLASASIGQVHIARLHDNTSVVIKVQHPGIENRIRCDLEILKLLAKLAQTYSPVLAQYRPVATIEEFSRTLLAELDFGKERNNLERFRRNFASRKDVAIPEPYADFSTQRVLTMDRLEGLSIKNTEEMRAKGFDCSEIANRGATMYLDMIFRDGFYHADPHPGNLLILADGRIGLLDCGMVGRIDDGLREQLENLLIAAASKDSRRLADLVIRIGRPPSDLDEDRLRTDIDEMMAEFAEVKLTDFDLSGALNRMTQIIRTYGIILPSRVSLLLKVLVMLEGSSRHLSPTFSLVELLQPYRMQIVHRRWSPKRLRRRAQRMFQDWQRFAEMLPSEMSDILQQVKRGRFDVHLEHRRLETTVNRLVMGLVVAALFMGSSQLWSNSVPPLLYGVSIPGSLGCFIAVTLGIRLLQAVKHWGNTS